MKRIFTHNRHGLIFLFLVLLAVVSKAQQVRRPEINPDEFIQRLVPVQQEDVNYEEFYEALFQFYQEPIDLNNATADELRSLFLLSELQINNLIRHRESTGDFLTLYELQTVAGFDLGVIRSILPFVEVREHIRKEDFKGIWRNAVENYLLIRADQTLESAKGFTDEKYAGSRTRIYTRYRLSKPKDYSLGFISEKDQGEKSLLDYYSFHLQVQNKGILKNLVLGDYLVQFGQGLVFSAGFAAGKGGEPVYTTRRSNLGIRPYNSLVENGSFRGAAATLKSGKTEWTLMFSNRKKDASITEFEDDGAAAVFSSMLMSGLHRTETEIANKNIIQEQNYGTNVVYRSQRVQIGASLIYTRLGSEYVKGDLPYNRFEFAGTANLVAGSNISYSWQNFNFFGEIARSSSGGIGATGGFVASLHPKLEWAFNLRSYDKDFHSFYGAAFGENSRNINERGIYNGLKYTPKKGLVLSAFYDNFRFPWLKYLVDAPSSGHDYLFRIGYQPNKKVNTYAQYHFEQKQKNLPDNKTHSDVPVNIYRETWMCTYENVVKRTLKFQSRIQYNTSRYENTPESGGLAFIQDIESTFRRIQLRSRIAFFKTDNYDSRVYAYENDVLYSVSFPAYYGKGIRLYLIGKVTVSRRIDFWLRVSQTRVSDRESIGSGTDALDKPQKTDVKVQLRYKL